MERKPHFTAEFHRLVYFIHDNFERMNYFQLAKYRLYQLTFTGFLNLPAGIWCKNDVVLTLMRRDDVTSTLIRRHFRTKCPLGSDKSIFKIKRCFKTPFADSEGPDQIVPQSKLHYHVHLTIK